MHRLALLFSLLFLTAFLGFSQNSKPNILLIMADDMGFSDLGCYGGEIETPNLDRLAENGLRFTQFRNTGRCCPTRASLLTGLYPHQAGIGRMITGKGANVKPGPYQGYLNNSSVTIAEVLKDAGYYTMMSGKWHVGEYQPIWPKDRGFDRYFGLISGAANYFNINITKNKNVKRQMALDDKPWTPPKEGFYMTKAITDHAVEFLDSLGTEAPPFFMYLAYTAPHWPLHAYPEDITKYRGKYTMGWDELKKQRYQRMLEMGLIDETWPLSPRNEETPAWEDIDNKDEMELKMAIYAAQVDYMDRGIGQVIDVLEKQGKLDNTLILFLSDNGACAEGGVNGHDFLKNGIPPGGENSYMSYGRGWAEASNTPLRLYKQWNHEGGIATPLIAHWPKGIKEKGAFIRESLHVTDVMPTLVDIAGAEYPSTYKGNEITPNVGLSMNGLFQQSDWDNLQYRYFEHLGHRAIVDGGTWKLVARMDKLDKKYDAMEELPEGAWELYNLAEDRTETQNLAKKYPDRVKWMIEAWNDWAERSIGEKRM